MVEKFPHCRNGPGPRSLETLQAGKTNVLGRVTKEADRTFYGCRIGPGDPRLKPLGGNTVDRSRPGLVMIRMTADSGIKPVRNVESSIRTHHHIGRAEQITSLAFDEVKTIEDIGRVLQFRVVAKDDLSPGITAQQHSGIPGGQGPVFVKTDPGGRTAAIDITGRQGSRIPLAPLGVLDRLPGALIGPPATLAVRGEESEEASFHEPGRPTSRRIIIVVLKHVPERGHGMLVTIAEAMADDADLTPVRIHPGREATHPYIAIRALSPSNGLGVGHGILASLVGPPDKILVSISGLQMRPAVSLVEIPLPIWTSHHGVQAVIMIPAIESAEYILPFVDLRIEP